MISTALFLVLIALLIWRLWIFFDKTRSLRELPTFLPTLPLLGHFHHFIFKGRDMLSHAAKVLFQARLYDRGNFCLWYGPIPVLVAVRPEDVQTILNNSKTLEKSSEYNPLNFALGDGLLAAPVPAWKTKRRHMSKMFHPNNVDHIVPSINRTCQTVVQQLLGVTSGEPVNIFDWMYDLSFNNAMNLMFGPNLDGAMDREDSEPVKEAMDMSLQLFLKRLAIPLLRYDYLFSIIYGKEIKRILTLVKYLPDKAIKAITKCKTYFLESTNEKIYDGDDETSGAITKCKTYFLESTNEKIYDGDDETSGDNGFTENEDRHINLLDIYKKMKKDHSDLSFENIVFDINTFIFGGTDTLAIMISNCVMALGEHDHIQERLFNEVVAVLGDNMEEVSSEDVKRLTYMDCVLKETTRMYTLFPIVGRKTAAEIKLSDCTVPAGFSVYVLIDGLHHNPRLFPNPGRFDPDRFTAEKASSRHKYSFVPFSGGPRDCLGKKYAWLSMKIALVHLLRQFRFITPKNIDTKYIMKGLMMRENGYPVIVQKRVCTPDRRLS